MLAGTLLAPRLDLRFDTVRLVVGGLLVAGAGLLLLGLLDTDSLGLHLVAMVLAAGGVSVPMSLVMNLVMGATPPERAGSAASLMETCGELGHRHGCRHPGHARHRDLPRPAARRAPHRHLAARPPTSPPRASARPRPPPPSRRTLAGQIVYAAQSAFTDGYNVVGVLGGLAPSSPPRSPRSGSWAAGARGRDRRSASWSPSRPDPAPAVDPARDVPGRPCGVPDLANFPRPPCPVRRSLPSVERPCWSATRRQETQMETARVHVCMEQDDAPARDAEFEDGTRWVCAVRLQLRLPRGLQPGRVPGHGLVGGYRAIVIPEPRRHARHCGSGWSIPRSARASRATRPARRR